MIMFMPDSTAFRYSGHEKSGLNGEESHCNVADAVKTHEICIAAEMSKLERKPIRLPL